MPDPVDLSAVLATFAEPWQPRTVATLNDYDVRIAKFHGEVTLGPGQVYVVPRGVHHQPVSADGAEPTDGPLPGPAPSLRGVGRRGSFR